MGLSSPASRESLHTRSIQCHAFRREDGLWDIEGHLEDIKYYEVSFPDRAVVHPEEPIHEMKLRITVDDDLLIHDAEAVMLHSPHNICPNITASYKKLIGLSIKSGWNHEVRNILGGVLGCTHLVDLLAPIATTAFQAIYPLTTRNKISSGDVRPPLLNNCHALSESSPVVKQSWPAYYKPKQNI